MEKRDYCSYNLTRECFLALEVASADTQRVSLGKGIETLSLNSGEGLWLVPYKGFPATDKAIPLDLIYLDEASVVIEVEESFVPSSRAPTLERAASVLILPAHTIYTSQTQPGDQLMLCLTGEMVRRLELLSSAEVHAGAAEDVAVVREMPRKAGEAMLLELKEHSRASPLQSSRAYEIGHSEPRKGKFKLPKNWFERWWSRDPRKGSRDLVQNLVAYYWTGSNPVAHRIRDISLEGMYLETEDRWYPGTIVLLTLQRTDLGEKDALRSIHLYTRAVRWGVDGVGLQFVLPGATDVLASLVSTVDSVSRKELQRFLEGVKTN